MSFPTGSKIFSRSVFTIIFLLSLVLFQPIVKRNKEVIHGEYPSTCPSADVPWWTTRGVQSKFTHWPNCIYWWIMQRWVRAITMGERRSNGVVLTGTCMWKSNSIRTQSMYLFVPYDIFQIISESNH